MASNPGWIGLNFASKRALIVARSGHDQATIRPRSGIDRGPGSRSAAVGSGWSDSATKDVSSSTTCLHRLMLSSSQWRSRPSDGDRIVPTCPRDASDREGSRPSTPHLTTCKKNQYIKYRYQSMTWHVIKFAFSESRAAT